MRTVYSKYILKHKAEKCDALGAMNSFPPLYSLKSYMILIIMSHSKTLIFFVHEISSVDHPEKL